MSSSLLMRSCFSLVALVGLSFPALADESHQDLRKLAALQAAQLAAQKERQVDMAARLEKLEKDNGELRAALEGLVRSLQTTAGEVGTLNALRENVVALASKADKAQSTAATALTEARNGQASLAAFRGELSSLAGAVQEMRFRVSRISYNAGLDTTTIEGNLYIKGYGDRIWSFQAGDSNLIRYTSGRVTWAAGGVP